MLAVKANQKNLYTDISTYLNDEQFQNKTLEKTADENLNIIRKWSLSILKILEMKKKYSLKKKRFALSCNFSSHI